MAEERMTQWHIDPIGPITASKFDIRTELQKAIKQAAGCQYQVDLIRLYIESYGAKE
jgi:hypothetical protein